MSEDEYVPTADGIEAAAAEWERDAQWARLTADTRGLVQHLREAADEMGGFTDLAPGMSLPGKVRRIADHIEDALPVTDEREAYELARRLRETGLHDPRARERG